MTGEHDPVFVAARRALLDALQALGAHAGNVIVIGAQAVYVHTGAIDLAIAEFTTDADLAIDVRGLADDPLIEAAMTAAGFYPNPTKNQPGAWCSSQGIEVDLMVPEAQAGAKKEGRRGARVSPHAKRALRRAEGLEAAVVDNEGTEFQALGPTDTRTFQTKVAGPAALVVAKLHKVGERIEGNPDRLIAKDAHDIYRLLVAVPTQDLATSISWLRTDDLAGDATRRAMEYLSAHFADPDGLGARLAGEAELGVGDPAQVQQAVAALTVDLLQALGFD